MESQPQFTPPLQDIPKPEPDETGHEEGPPSHRQGGDIDFRLKPEELEEYLNRYVVDQPEAVEVLATKICTHFNRMRLEMEEGVSNEASLGNIKSNVLMIGPTGVGKTFIIKLIADRIGVPFVKGDATKFSETGYVGGDVEDLVRDLVRDADGDIKRAEYGIIYIDEIDKIA
ncbi:MAG: AAA family ATPase, partial [Anaerolineae bacterium]|nr:AAA family ATPase [Anaerolineae bacterium]